MELKKYVLLERGTVLTKGMFEEQKKVDDWFATRLFIKTSDNILDLVEVGDMIRNSYGQIHEIDYVDDTHLFYNLSTSKTPKWVKNFVAIYKRQSNGDYKRYEVEA